MNIKPSYLSKTLSNIQLNTTNSGNSKPQSRSGSLIRIAKKQLHSKKKSCNLKTINLRSIVETPNQSIIYEGGKGESHSDIINNVNISQKFSRAQGRQQFNNYRESFIYKQMKLASMIKQVHSFIICVKQLKWIMEESCKLMELFLEKTQNQQYNPSQSHIIKEFKNLVQRFHCIQTTKMHEIALILHNSKSNQNEDIITESYDLRINPERVQNNYMQGSRTATTKSFKLTETVDNENIDSSNYAKNILDQSADFNKIKLPKCKNQQEIYDLQVKLQVSYNKIQQFQRTYQVLNEEIHILNKKIQHLQQEKQSTQGFNTVLKEELSLIQKKWVAYITYSQKTVKKIMSLLEKQSSPLIQNTRKLLQQIQLWQQELQLQQYGENQKDRRVAQITNLQWDINQLINMKLSFNNNINKNLKQQVKQVVDEDELMRFLLLQAVTIEQIITIN